MRRKTAAGILVAVLMSQYSGALGADAEEDYRAIFGSQADKVAASATTADDVEFAEKLIEAAGNASDSPELQIILCRKAYEYGVRNPAGYDTAMGAVKMLLEIAPDRFEKWKEKELAIFHLRYRSAGDDNRDQEASRYISALGDMGDAKTRSGKYKEALEYYTKALQVAASIKSPLRASFRRKARRMNEVLRQQSRAKALERMLRKNPDKTAVRRTLVMIYVVELDRPQQASEHLGSELDEVLRSYVPLAAKDIGEISQAGRLELAKWYESLVEEGSRYGKVNVLNRAASYYRRYIEQAKKKDAGYLQAKAGLDRVEDELIRLGGGARAVELLKGATVAMSFEKGTFFKREEQIYTRDLSSRDNHGQVHGLKPTGGVAGDALKFDGKGFVYVKNDKSVQITGDQTVAMWLRPDNFTQRRNPFGKAYGGEGAMTIEKDGSINYYCGQSGSNMSPYQAFGMTDKLQKGRWAHVAVVRDVGAKTVTWYKNGATTNRYKIKTATVKASSYPVLIGRGYTYRFQGLIDEFGMWSRCLDAEEIRALYKLGANDFPLGG